MKSFGSSVATLQELNSHMWTVATYWTAQPWTSLWAEQELSGEANKSQEGPEPHTPQRMFWGPAVSDRSWRKLGLEVTYSTKLNISENCSKLWSWNVKVSRATSMQREGMVPPAPSLAMPLLLYLARLGGERRRCRGQQEEAKGPPAPLSHAFSSPLPSSVVCSPDYFWVPGEPAEVGKVILISWFKRRV